MFTILKRQWNLSLAQRLLIVAFAVIYLVAFPPWANSNPSVAAGVYAGTAAMLVLAAMPRRLRLVAALAIAVTTAVVVLVAGRAVLGS